MSRAFVRESDGNDVPEDFPERPVSSHPNFVTARGLLQIQAHVHELEREREQAKAQDDKVTTAGIERDLRYWLQRRASAKLVEPEAEPAKVRFGVRVTVRYQSGEQRAFTLVGEDEADPATGRISWISPIAQSLLGSEVGDEVSLQAARAEITKLEAAAKTADLAAGDAIYDRSGQHRS